MVWYGIFTVPSPFCFWRLEFKGRLMVFIRKKWYASFWDMVYTMGEILAK